MSSKSSVKGNVLMFTRIGTTLRSLLQGLPYVSSMIGLPLQSSLIRSFSRSSMIWSPLGFSLVELSLKSSVKWLSLVSCVLRTSLGSSLVEDFFQKEVWLYWGETNILQIKHKLRFIHLIEQKRKTLTITLEDHYVRRLFSRSLNIP